MKNHFHILIRIKEEKEIGYLSSSNAKSEDLEIKWKTYIKEVPSKEFYKKPDPTQQFKHLFNAYSRWFNIRHGRRGSLFEKNYERKKVNNHKQLLNLLLYIHCNPVKHGFVDDIIEYPWTTYSLFLLEGTSLIRKKEVLKYFDDIDNFEYAHKNYMNKLSQELEGLEIE